METKPSLSEAESVKSDILRLQLKKVFKKSPKSMAVLLKLLLSKDKEKKNRS
ncbi:MAG: hypothetical protein ACLFQJ_01775 [Campylobacterales bacterium]